jgi:uracil-DNA glycosylase
MQITPSDISPEQAAGMLLWLMEAGADEITTGQPRNRCLEKAVTPPLAAAVQKPSTKPAQRPGPAIGTTADEAQAISASCTTLESLTQAFRQFDVNGLRRSAVQFSFLQIVEKARILVLLDRPRTEEEQEGGMVAGKQSILLHNMLKSINLSPTIDQPGEVVSMGNMVPWRPPGNRNPNDIEIAMCMPFIKRALVLLKPSLILAMGTLPGKHLAGGGDSVAQQRGKWINVKHDGLDIPLLATFPLHELLNYPERKRHAWRDLLMFRERMENL